MSQTLFFADSYGLKLGTRIFIQDIQPGSLADKSSEITSGDTVLMVRHLMFDESLFGLMLL